MSPRSVATRAKIVAVAERLFAGRGIEGASLNDINAAAGQGNKNATHYHFGNKQGLIQAIIDKHEPGIAQRRNRMLDELEARGELSLRGLVRVTLYPLADKLGDPDGGREYLRFSSQLVVNHTMAALNIGTPAFTVSGMDRLARAMRAVTPSLPDALHLQRGLLVGAMIMNGLAEHSRTLESLSKADAELLTRLFIANLEDCVIGVLGAPVSTETAALLPAPRAGKR